MPLSEFYRLANGKIDASQQKSHKPPVSADLSSVHESDFAELVWENGQLLMQGQSNRHRRVPTFNSLPSYCLPSYSPKSREKDAGNRAAESVVNEIPASGEMDLDQDDEMVHWLGYPMNQSVQNEYSDFLPELSGVTLNELSSHNNFVPYEKRGSGVQFVSDICTTEHNGARIEQEASAPIYSVGVAVRPKGSSASQPCPLSSESCQNLPMYSRPRVTDHIGNQKSEACPDHAAFGDSLGALTSVGGFPGIKVHKQDQSPSASNSGIMNFSHFSRPAALFKANLQNRSPISGTKRFGSKEKASALVSSTFAEALLINPSTDLRRETISATGQSKENIITTDPKPLDEAVSAEAAEAIVQNVSKNDDGASKIVGDSMTNGSRECEWPVEPAVAPSSVCSASSVEKAPDEQPSRDLKRKPDENDESEYPSEDAEEESVGMKKAAPARGTTGSKRSRAAEVHNLSERRRRDRINEKMRALQELIPNCNKVDKASMLDEAIEYLKTLQLQVQIMSMGAGLYMPPVMFPSGMQHMHPAHMAQFSPMMMGAGMGFGMGYGMGIPEVNGGSSSCPMVQMPPMHGSTFPGPQITGPSPVHGMAGPNIQLYGIPAGQALTMSMQRAPLVPLAGGPFVKPASGAYGCATFRLLDNMDSTIASTSKDSIQNIKLQGMQNTGTNSSTNQTPGESEVKKEGLKRAAAVQDCHRASEATPVVPFGSSSGNDK